MRRLLGIVAALAAIAAFAVLSTGAGEDSSGVYKVRAIFQNASFVIPGEQVRIAGVTVGKVADLDVAPDQNAIIDLEITEPGFGDWRQDAECIIRPQSLIGEKFVECTPTQPRPVGQAAPPPLKKIEEGDGEGMHLLPVSQTRRPVDIDLVGNTLRLPYRQRLALLINEFGGALAGRGQDLNKIIRSADPALAETDKVLKILGDQNQVLPHPAENSDTALAPLARDRAQVADFLTQAKETAQATAERREDLEANLQKLPTFLRELKPTMTRLGALSDEMTPVLKDLGRVAPDLNRLVLELGPFSEQATPALARLGDASDVGRDALVKTRPIIKDLRTLTATAKPVAEDLKALTTSLRDTGGIERFMDYVFYQVAAINGFDQLGHYLRAILVVNLCSTYAIENDPACTANFVDTGEGTKASASSRNAKAALAKQADGRSPGLARLDAVLRGMTPDEALGRDADEGTKTRKKARPKDALNLPAQVLPGAAQPEKPAVEAPAGQPGTTTPAPAAGGAQTTPAPAAENADAGAVGGLLDYLLGGP